MVDGSCTTNDELIVMQMRLASNQQPGRNVRAQPWILDSNTGAVHQVVINL